MTDVHVIVIRCLFCPEVERYGADREVDNPYTRLERAGWRRIRGGRYHVSGVCPCCAKAEGEAALERLARGE